MPTYNDAKPLVEFTDKELNEALVSLKAQIRKAISGSNVDMMQFDYLGDSMRDLLKERRIRRECKEDLYRSADDAYKRWLTARATYGN